MNSEEKLQKVNQEIKQLELKRLELIRENEREKDKEELSKIRYVFTHVQGNNDADKLYYLFMSLGIGYKEASGLVSTYKAVDFFMQGVDSFCIDRNIPKKKILSVIDEIDKLCRKGQKYCSEKSQEAEARPKPNKKSLTEEQAKLLEV